jgi:hypothetical protein
MQRRFSRFVLAATAAFVLLTASPARPQTDNGHYSCFPLTVLFFDDCTGEMISGEGQVCIASSFRMDNSGGGHASFQFRSDFTAVGLTSGRRYTEHDSANDVANISGNNGQYSATFTQIYHVNTPGGGNNLSLKELFHITFNANGEITSFNPDEFTFVCK